MSHVADMELVLRMVEQQRLQRQRVADSRLMAGSAEIRRAGRTGADFALINTPKVGVGRVPSEERHRCVDLCRTLTVLLLSREFQLRHAIWKLNRYNSAP